MDGFSLHAAVRVEARDRDRLEYLCRYAGRPAIAESRLSLLPDGRVLYSLKKRWKDGSTSVVIEPQVLME
ncbi:MAG TPA: transposase, partial [Planctomycetota bacterium]|nr:transposase [Planctomycetota bacterium]